ncbi:MAG: hypothetical protein U0169_20955 [Polyangiaceae bacterium]
MVACGKSVCDDAADVIKGCTSATSEASGSAAEVKCEGTVQKASQCIVDNKDAACGKGDADALKKYTDCLTASTK